jgi:serine/threonine protein kinase
MDYNLVKTCASLQNELGELNTKTYYISNKIRYVGTDTLVNYMNSWNKSPPTLYRKLINTHLHILEAIQKLYEKYIVHFDIKPQNIVHDDIQDIPIIIDFGLARDISPLFNPHINLADNDSLLHNIFVNHNSYAYWCIDIHILSNIGNKSLLKPTETVTTQQIKTIVAGFLTPNFEAMLSVEDIAQFKQNTLSYFSSYVDKEQTWQSVFSDLIQYYKSWDNYSAAMTYLYTYHKCAITTSSNNDGDAEIMHRYISILKNIIMDMPNTRPTAEQTRELILNLVSNNTN